MVTRRGVFVFVLLASIIAGCGGTYNPPGGGNGNTYQQRCNGQSGTSNTQLYTYYVRDNVSKCILAYVQVYADSDSEATTCAQATINQNGLNATPVPGPVDYHFFGVYLANGLGGYYCSTLQLTSDSSSDAAACAPFAAQCSNCTYVDITSQVYAPPTIDGSALDNWCTNHPTP